MSKMYEMLDAGMREDMGEYVHRKWSEARKSPLREQVLGEVEDAKDVYDQIPNSEPVWEDAINLVIPFFTISVDQLEPRLVASIVGRDEVVKVDDRGEMDEELSTRIEEVDNSVLLDDVQIVSETKKHVHKLLVEGQVYLAPYWDFREGKVREYMVGEDGLRTPVPPEYEGLSAMGFMITEKTVPLSDRARVEEIDIRNLFFPDQIDDWEEAPVIYEYYMEWGKYKTKVMQGKAGWVRLGEEELEELEQKLHTSRPVEPDSIVTEVQEEKAEKGREAEKLKAELRFLQGHFNYDIDGDGVEEKVICTIEESTKQIVYLIDNAELDPLNRKQIRKLTLIPRANTGYGYSLYSKLKMIVEGGSSTVNILLNSCLIQMMPFFFYEEAAGFKEQEAELYPGAGIAVADVQRVKMNQFTPNASAFKDIVGIFMQLWQYIIVLPDYNVGQDTKREGSTATGVLALLQEAAISHDYLGSILHDQYTELFEIIHDLCYLNMSETRVMELLGTMEPTPRVLSNGYKLRLAATSKSANRHVDRMEMQEALMVASQGVEMGTVVPDEPIRDFLQTFKGVNVEKWMNGPVSQVCARLRASLGMEGTKGSKGQRQEEWQVPDPFGQVVMMLLQIPPEQIMELMKALNVGAMVKDEVTGMVGPVPDEDAMQ